jgi:hypothetical protein
VHFKSASNFAVRRVQQDAFPNRAHDPPKCKRFGEKIMRHLIIERDRTQNRSPLLLIALACCQPDQSFSLPKQAQVFSHEFQAQYQAFVRFAVTSSAALSAIALKWDLAFGTFHSGRALV